MQQSYQMTPLPPSNTTTTSPTRSMPGPLSARNGSRALPRPPPFQSLSARLPPRPKTPCHPRPHHPRTVEMPPPSRRRKTLPLSRSPCPYPSRRPRRKRFFPSMLSALSSHCHPLLPLLLPLPPLSLSPSRTHTGRTVRSVDQRVSPPMISTSFGVLENVPPRPSRARWQPSARSAPAERVCTCTRANRHSHYGDSRMPTASPLHASIGCAPCQVLPAIGPLMIPSVRCLRPRILGGRCPPIGTCGLSNARQRPSSSLRIR